jgi:hypothetical protein
VSSYNWRMVLHCAARWRKRVLSALRALLYQFASPNQLFTRLLPSILRYQYDGVQPCCNGLHRRRTKGHSQEARHTVVALTFLQIRMQLILQPMIGLRYLRTNRRVAWSLADCYATQQRGSGRTAHSFQ